ncbi:cold shock domain-containing protein E1 [Caerostris darwini]|uniref:Cold shock domain-containing protein E1 n=1 Tax=Caerostris darwini TaxID=1538125 RepID=A0AAV4PL17_9ARAC|nr:cold shock domain-containing protein E1 [Caerostris darwini]
MDTIEKGKPKTSDAMPGKLRCHQHDEIIYYPFGERDPKVEYTLLVGDWVQFNIATDRRDNLQRATNIELLENGINFTKEKREQGFVTALKETFGFIIHGQRETRIYFRLNEVINPDQIIKTYDEVEFTVVQDHASPGRTQAIRIKILPPGTLEHPNLIMNGSTKSNQHGNDDYTIVGVVEKEAHSRWNMDSPHKPNRKSIHEENGEENSDDGVIVCNRNGMKDRYYFSNADCESRNYPRPGDKVEFVVVSKDDKLYATHIRILPKVRNGFKFTHRGFIAALKDTFGFIETEDHDKEVFFHYSVFDGNPSSLEVGQEVEYGVTHKGSKLSAECVRKLSSNTIPREDIQPEILNGVVIQPLRCFNPDQEHYPGKVRLASHAENMEEDLAEYEFACSVVKISDGQPMQRPERLNRLRTISSDGGGPRLILIRQPKGPDGSTGFKLLRSVKKENQSNSVPDQINETCSVNNELHINAVEPNPIVCSQG